MFAAINGSPRSLFTLDSLYSAPSNRSIISPEWTPRLLDDVLLDDDDDDTPLPSPPTPNSPPTSDWRALFEKEQVSRIAAEERLRVVEARSRQDAARRDRLEAQMRVEIGREREQRTRLEARLAQYEHNWVARGDLVPEHEPADIGLRTPEISESYHAGKDINRSEAIRNTAVICKSFLVSSFECPDKMNSPTDVAGVYHLTRFIAVILRDAGLSNWYFAAYGALYLLKKLKSRFPKARGSCGFRLFLASFMIASKTMSDIAHTNGEWAEMGMSLFSTKVLFRMECEMFNYLDWKLIIRSEELEHFIAQVQREFGSHLYD